MARLRRKAEAIEVPDWSAFGIGLQLCEGVTFGRLLGEDAPMPSESVLRVAWARYRDRLDPDCWAGLVFDQGVDPDEARARFVRAS